MEGPIIEIMNGGIRHSQASSKKWQAPMVLDCSNIAAISNIPTQVFEHMLGGIQFRTILQSCVRALEQKKQT
jgi:hypothetical protein